MRNDMERKYETEKKKISGEAVSMTDVAALRTQKRDDGDLCARIASM